MKAISLWQPWATLISTGDKTWETRSWATTYRGPLAIHAAKKFGPLERLLAFSGWYGVYLRNTGYERWEELPLGMYVALVDLVDVIPTTEAALTQITMQEELFGDYSPGRWAWKLENIRAIKPLPAQGRQRLWDVPDHIEKILQGRIMPRLVPTKGVTR